MRRPPARCTALTLCIGTLLRKSSSFFFFFSEPEVPRVRVQVVEVEEEVAVRRLEDLRARTCASSRSLPGGSISVATFSRSGSAPDDGARPRDVARGPVDRGGAARRRREVADLDPAAAHEREVLGPEVRPRDLRDAREGFEAALVDGRRGREAEGNPVEDDGDVRAERPRGRAPRAPGAPVQSSAITSTTSSRSAAARIRSAIAGRQPSPKRSFTSASAPAAAAAASAAARGAARRAARRTRRPRSRRTTRTTSGRACASSRSRRAGGGRRRRRPRGARPRRRTRAARSDAARPLRPEKSVRMSARRRSPRAVRRGKAATAAAIAATIARMTGTRRSAGPARAPGGSALPRPPTGRRARSGRCADARAVVGGAGEEAEAGQGRRGAAPSRRGEPCR